ncbi:major capsid protein [uncultured Brevundimonas sp.]|uniref:major capsid protein n=1 Tax=uncultured Brevundimonas sp. TaxID=213418 RepID=UPI0026133F5E|nr:major capsid protein [uncultured Brevundimonas sp.]
MSLSHMKVFNDTYQPAIIETLAQMVEKFNEASNGAIRLTTDGFGGDFLQESFFASLHAAQRRVDRYATNSSASPTDLTQLQHNSVKVAGGFGPVVFEPSQLTWLNKPTAEGVEVISRNFAEAMLKDQLNTAIAALVAALSVAADSKFDVSALSAGKNEITQSALNNSHALFGDASSNLVAQVMTGAMYHKLIGQNLANAQGLYNAGSVRVLDVLGKAVIVTDAPALYTAPVTSPATAGKDRVLSLAEGAAIVHDGGDIISNIDTRNGKQRIETTLQVDYTFGLGLKGYAWDTANGGKSPTDAEIATGSNWDRIATSVKHTAGVIAIGKA